MSNRIAYEGVHSHKREHSRTLLAEIRSRQWVGDVTTLDAPAIPLPIVETSQGEVIGLPQRKDMHALSVESHQVQCAKLVNQCFGSQFSFPGDEQFHFNPDRFAAMPYDEEELNTRRDLLHILHTLSQNVSSVKQELLWFWARTHDEGKFRESILHLPTRIVWQNIAVPIDSPRKRGSERLVAFHKDSRAVVDSEELTKIFWNECATRGYLPAEFVEELHILHGEYAVLSKALKNGKEMAFSPWASAEEKLYAVCCLLADTLGKGIDGLYFPEMPYSSNRKAQIIALHKFIHLYVQTRT